tara:strand:+ start:987 stop:2321 length:1335 start_codon:yes stop_codon:yes gene_type:complete
MFIFIEVEIVGRELLGKILLSRALISDHTKIIISDRNKIKKLILNNKIKNSILIIKDINPREDLLKYYKLLKSKGFLIISQDEEGGFLSNDYSLFSTIRHKNGETIKIIDYFLCWGKRDFNFLRKKFKNLKHKIINFGSPKLDAMHKNFQINKEVLKKNKITKKFILLSYNFSPFYYKTFDTRSFEFSELLKNKFKNYYKELFYSESENFKLTHDFTELADFLDKNQSEYQVVIRPHPNFDIEAFKHLMKYINKNIIVCNRGDLLEYTKNCSVLIHNSCSSSVDAAIIGKQLICYKSRDKKYFTSSYLNSLGIKCENHFEVLKVIKSKKIKINTTLLHKRLNLDNSLIKLKKIVNNSKIINDNKNNKINFDKSNINFKSLIKKIIYLFVDRDTKNISTEMKYRDFDYKNIRRIVNQVNNYKFKGIDQKIKFKLISNNFLKIEKS